MPTLTVTDPILDLAGAPMTASGGSITYRAVIVEALTMAKRGDENLSWQERRDIFELARKVAENDVVETSGADLVLVMGRLAPIQSTVIVGRVAAAMDVSAEIAAAEAEAQRQQDERQAASE
ncbi:hypothetical protein [Phenylobacterium sp.]|uniref:hypothetical protein n=1 Tax=Phenylobacterium sp. TaxID=1871053 RepID=UPI002716D54C|nr:hypothetical protein [Phenylobacterium sp.]MDO8800041.1 hypothetical protein [Phenylobacterium sp.]